MTGLIGGYRIDVEDREFIHSESVKPIRMLAASEHPERVDPRRSELFRDGWLRIEDQKNQGSCAGHALSTIAEMAYGIATGKSIQLSRQFAYVAVQRFYDNIRTDAGSTISGGTKLARERGVCREEIAPYQQSYPGWGWITQEMLDDAQNYKLQSHTEMNSAEEIKSFLASGMGGVQIGVSWGSSFTPDGKGCVRDFRPGGGGHSVAIIGYVPDDDVGAKSSRGYWELWANSWGTRFGVNGFFYVDPSATDKMLKHQWSAFVGRSDMKTPDVRALPHDFTKPGKGITV